MPLFQPLSSGPVGSFPNLPSVGAGDYFPANYFPRRYFAALSGPGSTAPAPPPTLPTAGPGEYWAPRYFPLRYFGQNRAAVVSPLGPGVPGKYWPPRYFTPRYFPWYGPLQIPPTGQGVYWAPRYFAPRYWGQNQRSQVVIPKGAGPYWARGYFAQRYWGYFFPLGIASPSTAALWTFRARVFAPWTFRSWYSLGVQLPPAPTPSPTPGEVDDIFDDATTGRGLIFSEPKRGKVWSEEDEERGLVFTIVEPSRVR